MDGTEDALNSIMAAIKAAGYEPGKDVTIAMDCAASEFYHDGVYDYTKFEGEKGAKRNAQQQVAYLSELVNKSRLILSRMVWTRMTGPVGKC